MGTKKRNYTNTEVAEFLQNIATAYEIKNKNYFRIVSYQNAAETIFNQKKSVQDIWQQNKGNLDNLPGIGQNILTKLDYLFTHHDYHPAVKKAFSGIHPSVFTFTKVNGIGPKNSHKITQQLKFPNDPLKALNKLIDYAKKGEIRSLPTFGEKSEQLILENTLHFLGRHKRMELEEAQDIANRLISYMHQKFPDIEFVPLGSLRRQTATVGDIDLAAKSTNTQDILNYFIEFPDNIQTIVKGPKKASIRIYHDIRIDLMVQPPKSFGSLLQHFTGSRQHNIILRRYAQERGYSVSEYGIRDLKTGKLHTFETEAELYNFLKLDYIPPQKRTGDNEIETAKNPSLPKML